MVEKNAIELFLKIRDLANEYLQSTDNKTSKETSKEVETDVALDQLPWKQYPTGNGHWIFSNTPAAQRLVQELAEKNGTATIGEFNYKLTGNGRFIARHRIKR
jgi:hypothetical protein